MSKTMEFVTKEQAVFFFSIFRAAASGMDKQKPQINAAFRAGNGG